MNCNISAASDTFKALIEEQMARVDCMKHSEKREYKLGVGKIKLGIADGDGIGPIIMQQTRRLLEKLLEKELKAGSIEIVDITGLTLENRLACGEGVPKSTLEQIKSVDILLKGPTTTPKGTLTGKNLESANVILRRELDLYANVRPIKIPGDKIDWTFFRENTEGEYTLGSKGFCIDDKIFVDFKITSVIGTERIARAAMKYAVSAGKNKITVVTKANILKHTDGAFSDICRRIAEDEFPQLELEERYIDIMCANILDENVRSSFEVIVLPNLYGDIITDEAAQLQGGVGTAGSANIGDRYAMFEAIHGSAPSLVEKGLAEWASPESIFRAVVLMLEHINAPTLAKKLSNALDSCNIHANGTKNGATAHDYTSRIIELL